MFLVAEIVPSPRRQSYFTDAFKEERMIFSGVDFAVPRGVKNSIRALGNIVHHHRMLHRVMASRIGKLELKRGVVFSHKSL